MKFHKDLDLGLSPIVRNALSFFIQEIFVYTVFNITKTVSTLF